MQAIRKHMKKGKLYFMSHLAYQIGTLVSTREHPVGTPMMFLSYRGSENGDKFEFLIVHKKETFVVRNNSNCRKSIEKVFIPLQHLEWYLTNFNKQDEWFHNFNPYRDTLLGMGPLQIQSVPMQATTRKLKARWMPSSGEVKAMYLQAAFDALVNELAKVLPIPTEYLKGEIGDKKAE